MKTLSPKSKFEENSFQAGRESDRLSTAIEKGKCGVRGQKNENKRK
jgi:hypothetical protein